MVGLTDLAFSGVEDADYVLLALDAFQICLNG
jgi:hypothetical protein